MEAKIQARRIWTQALDLKPRCSSPRVLCLRLELTHETHPANATP